MYCQSPKYFCSFLTRTSLHPSIARCRFHQPLLKAHFHGGLKNTLLMVICNLLMYLKTLILFRTKSASQNELAVKLSPRYLYFFPPHIYAIFGAYCLYIYDNRISPLPMYKSLKKKRNQNKTHLRHLTSIFFTTTKHYVVKLNAMKCQLQLASTNWQPEECVQTIMGDIQKIGVGFCARFFKGSDGGTIPERDGAISKVFFFFS